MLDEDIHLSHKQQHECTVPKMTSDSENLHGLCLGRNSRHCNDQVHFKVRDGVFCLVTLDSKDLPGLA